jgi:uracil-DNA glycosylase family 4
MSDEKKELSHIVASALAHIEVERELGEEGIFLPQEVGVLSKRVRSSGVRNNRSLSLSEKQRKLEKLAREAAMCTACDLNRSRNKSVFSSGTPDAELVFVGEGPGQEEDREGVPFVGQAGQLLDRMIAAMGYERDEVYICNVVKCHPPQNRTPSSVEAQACERFLSAQLSLVAPKVIVALGKCAALALNVANETGSWRGEWKSWRDIAVMPTYHPAFLLRSPKFKRTVWEDLQNVMKKLSKSRPR